MAESGFLLWLASKARWSRKGVRHSEMSDCLNCSEALTDKTLYCPTCGQKVHESKLTVWSLLAEFFAGLFNIENSLYSSLKSLPIPGYLSKQFISGKRKQYINPIRFFLVSLIIHIAALNFYVASEDLQELSNEQIEEIGKIKLYEQYLKTRDTLTDENIDLLGLDTILFKDLIGNDSYRTLDLNGDLTNLNLQDYTIDKVEAFEMPIDELVEKLEPKDWYEKLILTQVFRTIRDPVGAVRYAMGTLIWSVLLTIFLTGLLMKLIYIRKNRFYIEHLIVLFHIHTFSFFITSIGLLVAYFIGSPIDENDSLSKWIYIPYILVLLFFLLSIKSYYKQGWFKTLIKYFIIGLTYMIVLTTAIVSVGFLSLLFFK